MRMITNLRAIAAILAIAVAAATPAVTAAQVTSVRPHVKNIVLVHGAWGDGGGWQGVYKILAEDGYTVSIVTHSNESLASDVADTQRILDRQDT